MFLRISKVVISSLDPKHYPIFKEKNKERNISLFKRVHGYFKVIIKIYLGLGTIHCLHFAVISDHQTWEQ